MLAQDLGDRAVEAQACYSLGNTYTLLRDYPTAIDYHLRHLRIAEELMDKVGEGKKSPLTFLLLPYYFCRCYIALLFELVIDSFFPWPRILTDDLH